jgi:3'-phosphoadenosine 5'-phosphosulfate sulfotransferase (PAPS reductase)/FAD synthetase
MNILWFSAGATSAVACKLAIKKFGKDNVKIIYFHIDTAHPDNFRFIEDCENWFNVKIDIESSKKYKNQFDVIKKTKFINSPQGARCTYELKRKVREHITNYLDFDTQVFGFEYTEKEINRSKRLSKDLNPYFPLIENKLTKSNCLYILKQAGIELPMMYRLGYPNNNCIGCVKGGMGYWNKIRLDFPDIFEKMAITEREISNTCLKDDSGLIYLDELDSNRGRKLEIILPDCSLFCHSEYSSL